jgi:hypothetical protein
MDQRSRSIVQGVAQTMQDQRPRNTKQNLPEQEQFAATESQMKRTLHDMDAFKSKKMSESSPFFRTTRV